MTQDTFISTKWGTLTFLEGKPEKCCSHCLLRHGNECSHAPCTPMERNDGKEGYFTVREFPQKKEQTK